MYDSYHTVPKDPSRDNKLLTVATTWKKRFPKHSPNGVPAANYFACSPRGPWATGTTVEGHGANGHVRTLMEMDNRRKGHRHWKIHTGLSLKFRLLSPLFPILSLTQVTPYLRVAFCLRVRFRVVALFDGKLRPLAWSNNQLTWWPWRPIYKWCVLLTAPLKASLRSWFAIPGNLEQHSLWSSHTRICSRWSLNPYVRFSKKFQACTTENLDFWWNPKDTESMLVYQENWTLSKLLH